MVRLLGLEPGGPVVWEPDDRMQLLVADSPQEMEAFLDDRRAERLQRPHVRGLLLAVVPGAQAGRPAARRRRRSATGRAPGTCAATASVSGAPPSALWATDPAGFGQIGCVYTAQGFEYDWSGVIIGPDLVWRGDRWVTDRTASKDPVFKKSTPDADVDRLIRNTYKVLLTRGMVGTVVYSTDPETQEKLRELVGAGRRVAVTV